MVPTIIAPKRAGGKSLRLVPGTLGAARRVGTGLQNAGLLNHPREVRNRLFVDGRRLGLGLERLPDGWQVAAGQDCQEAGRHIRIKSAGRSARQSPYRVGLGPDQSHCRSRMLIRSACDSSDAEFRGERNEDDSRRKGHSRGSDFSSGRPVWHRYVQSND
jgi:hypothetical protein